MSFLGLIIFYIHVFSDPSEYQPVLSRITFLVTYICLYILLHIIRVYMIKMFLKYLAHIAYIYTLVMINIF